MTPGASPPRACRVFWLFPPGLSSLLALTGVAGEPSGSTSSPRRAKPLDKREAPKAGNRRHCGDLVARMVTSEAHMRPIGPGSSANLYLRAPHLMR